MDVPTLKLSPRSVTGKKVKVLRRNGIVPVHVYGRNVPPQSLQADALVLRRLLPRVGTNVPLSVEVEDREGEEICFVREIQRHPVTEDVLHVDFLRVDVSQVIQAGVPLILQGTAPAVREQGGTLLQPLQDLLVEALPMNIPATLEVDVSGLDDFEKGIYVRDVSVGANITVITEADALIARVSPPRVEAVEGTEAEEGVEGEEAAEGAPAAASTEASTEA
jgi:large subunit ribosomal protein L25